MKYQIKIIRNQRKTRRGDMCTITDLINRRVREHCFERKWNDFNAFFFTKVTPLWKNQETKCNSIAF